MHTIVELTEAPLGSYQGAKMGQVATPVGQACLVWDDLGIREFGFAAEPPEMMGAPIGSPIGGASISREDAKATALVTAAFGQGPLTLPLVLSGTDFQRQVWRALLQVPVGETISYAQLASRVGKPGAARAVGSAVGANRIGFLVPCHRVVRQDGVIGQFRWGSDVKQRLLQWESRLTHG